MRTKTFKKSTILSAFRKTGLISYNPEIVLQKIRPADSQIPHRDRLHLLHLPILLVVSATKHLDNDKRLVHRKFQPHLERFIRCFHTSAFTHHLLDRDLDATYKEAAARAAQKRLTGRIAQKGGVITMREIKGRITKQAKDEVQKARNALRRAEIATEKKAKARINARKGTRKALFKEVKAYLKARSQLAKSLT
ncbi:hypothetical protein MMC31_005226 [Peltigera leucophlebia]|nr:hypothetical protein [Peltigera leucophlebia]